MQRRHEVAAGAASSGSRGRRSRAESLDVRRRQPPWPATVMDDAGGCGSGPIMIHLRLVRRCEKGAARGGGAPLSALGTHVGPSAIRPAARSGGAAAGENHAGFGYGGRWRHLRRRFLIEASSLQSASPISDCSGGRPGWSSSVMSPICYMWSSMI